MVRVQKLSEQVARHLGERIVVSGDIEWTSKWRSPARPTTSRA